MATAEAEERDPAAIFEDEEEDDDSTSDDDTDDDDDEAGPPQSPPTQGPAAPPPPASTMVTEGLATSTANSAAPTPPNANPNPISTMRTTSDPATAAAVATPQNGTIAVHPIAVNAAPDLSAAFFNPSSSFLTPASAPTNRSDVVTIEDRKPLTIAYDESRRLFQRLWTDDDELKILQGFYEFTSKRGTTFASHQYDTGPFYEDIKKQLNLEFTKNQLIEKIRRLKKKFRNCCSRMHSMGCDFHFRSAHERSVYDIAKNIWNPSIKRARDSDDEEMMMAGGTPKATNQIITIPVNEGSFSSNQRGSGRASRRRMRRRYAEEAAAAAAAAAAPAAAVGAATAPATCGVATAVDNSVPVMHTPLASVAGIPSVVVEETVKSCLSPLFKELINSAIAGGPLAPGLAGGAALFNLLPLSLGGSAVPASVAPADAKWREQQILELEVYLRRIELMRDQIKMTLEELKSSRS